MSLLDKEAVKRAKKVLKDFDTKINDIILDKFARITLDAANSLNFEIGAIIKSPIVQVIF